MIVKVVHLQHTKDLGVSAVAHARLVPRKLSFTAVGLYAITPAQPRRCKTFTGVAASIPHA